MPQSPSPSLAVIFDMDGVLVDSNQAHFQAFQRIGSEVGAPFTREMLDRTVGMHNNQIFPLWLGEGLSPDRIVELALRKEAYYREIAAQALRPIPGAPELARALRREGFRLAVGSSGPKPNVELAVRTLGLGDAFDVLVTGDDVRHGKPDPEIFLQAASRLGVSPERCLVIEDAVQGIRAALAAGMQVIGVATSLPAAALTEATRVLPGPSAITADLIREILADREPLP